MLLLTFYCFLCLENKNPHCSMMGNGEMYVYYVILLSLLGIEDFNGLYAKLSATTCGTSEYIGVSGSVS